MGWTATGFDPDPEIIAAGRRQYNRDLRVAAPNPYDMIDDTSEDRAYAIWFSHVLEHLPDPVTVLKTLSQKFLSKSGNRFIFIEVPNPQTYDYEREFSCDGHIHFFSQKSLDLMCQRAGLHVINLAASGPFLKDQIDVFHNGGVKALYVDTSDTNEQCAHSKRIWLRATANTHPDPNVITSSFASS